jgi:hypothetical protein
VRARNSAQQLHPAQLQTQSQRIRRARFRSPRTSVCATEVEVRASRLKPYQHILNRPLDDGASACGLLECVRRNREDDLFANERSACFD